jgi:hypothetical protein
MIPKPQHPKSLCGEPRGTLLIGHTLFTVWPAIDFDPHFPLEGDEVSDVRTDRRLAPKLVAVQLPETQMSP